MLVDTGATHNFIGLKEAKEWGVKFTKVDGDWKTVNTSSKPLSGKAWKVPVRLGKWRGKLDFLIVDMGEEEVVLGQDFLKQVVPVTFFEDKLKFKSQGAEFDVAWVESKEEGVQIKSLRASVPKGRHLHRSRGKGPSKARGRANIKVPKGRHQPLEGNKAHGEANIRGVLDGRKASMPKDGQLCSRCNASYRGARCMGRTNRAFKKSLDVGKSNALGARRLGINPGSNAFQRRAGCLEAPMSRYTSTPWAGRRKPDARSSQGVLDARCGVRTNRAPSRCLDRGGSGRTSARGVGNNTMSREGHRKSRRGVVHGGAMPTRSIKHQGGTEPTRVFGEKSAQNRSWEQRGALGKAHEACGGANRAIGTSYQGATGGSNTTGQHDESRLGCGSQ